jgi:hypothetical protein
LSIVAPSVAGEPRRRYGFPPACWITWNIWLFGYPFYRHSLRSPAPLKNVRIAADNAAVPAKPGARDGATGAT